MRQEQTQPRQPTQTVEGVLNALDIRFDDENLKITGAVIEPQLMHKEVVGGIVTIGQKLGDKQFETNYNRHGMQEHYNVVKNAMINEIDKQIKAGVDLVKIDTYLFTFGLDGTSAADHIKLTPLTASNYKHDLALASKALLYVIENKELIKYGAANFLPFLNSTSLTPFTLDIEKYAVPAHLALSVVAAPIEDGHANYFAAIGRTVGYTSIVGLQFMSKEAVSWVVSKAKAGHLNDDFSNILTKSIIPAGVVASKVLEFKSPGSILAHVASFGVAVGVKLVELRNGRKFAAPYFINSMIPYKRLLA